MRIIAIVHRVVAEETHREVRLAQGAQSKPGDLGKCVYSSKKPRGPKLAAIRTELDDQGGHVTTQLRFAIIGNEAAGNGRIASDIGIAKRVETQMSQCRAALHPGRTLIPIGPQNL